MELFNFGLSYYRLKKRIRFKTRIRGAALAFLASVSAVLLSLRLFDFSGKAVTAFWLVMKMAFALSAFILLLTAADIIKRIKNENKS